TITPILFAYLSFFPLILSPPRSPLFPSTTLFRSLTGELKAITLHHWGADGQDFDNVVSWLVADGNGNNRSSAHEVIEGGRVAVLASIEDGTWNSGNAQGNLDNYALECRPEADEANVRTVV